MNYNEKQLQIINAAERLFADRGYDGTSVRDIAEEAKINIAMISYYFGSKEKLIQAVFELRTNHLTTKIESLLKDEVLTSIEKIGVLIEDYILKIKSKQKFYKLMICEQMLEKNTVVTDLLNDLKKRNAELIDKLIKEGQAKGDFKNNIDVVLLLNTMTGTIMQTFINKDYYKSMNKLEEMPDDEYVELLMNRVSTYLKDLFKSLLSHEG